jgi:hypothetical protein
LGFNGLLQINLATPFLILPMTAITTITEALGFAQLGGELVSNTQENGGHYYKIACEAVSQMNPITLSIEGNQKYVIQPQQLVIGNGNECISLFYGLENIHYWTLGGAGQLNKLFTFDYDANEVTIAELMMTG